MRGEDITRIPFRLVEKMVAVEAEINGAAREFYIDTGAPTLVLGPEFSAGGKVAGLAGVEGGVEADRSVAVDFRWAGRVALSGSTSVVDLPEEEDRRRIAGLIGYDVLKEFDVLFDYRKRELVLADPSFSEEAFGDIRARAVIVPFDMHHHLPVVRGMIGETPFRLGFDSGADTNLLSQGCLFALDGELSDTGSELLEGAGEEETRVMNGRIRNLSIGSREFQNTATVVTGIAHLNRHAEVKIDGIVGYEILSRQRTLIRYAAKEIWFMDD